jgi:hypothetical protein
MQKSSPIMPACKELRLAGGGVRMGQFGRA